VDAIIPMVLDKVLEAMRPHVEKIVNDRLQPYIETIEHTKTTVLAQDADSFVSSTVLVLLF
jgi:hypothetical protein